MRLVAAFLLLWLPFSAACLAAIPVALWAVLAEENVYAKDLLRAMDKVMAALLGWGGRYTVSAECGSRQSACAFCKLVCWLLNKLDPGHCEGAAKREGLS